MEVSFALPNIEQKQLLEFKKELEKQLGKQNVELAVATPQPGEMGIVVTDVVKAALDKEHLGKVKEFLTKFIKNHKIEMSLENAKGEKIKLTAAMEKEILYMILNGFFERTLVDEQVFNPQKKLSTNEPDKRKKSKTKKNSKQKKTTNKTKATKTRKQPKKPKPLKPTKASKTTNRM